MKNAVVFTDVDGLIYWMIPPSDSSIIKPVHGPFSSEAAAREDIARSFANKCDSLIRVVAD